MIIPGFEKYDIAENGVVTNIKTGKAVKPYICTTDSGKQYLHVSLSSKDFSTAAPHNVLRLLAITYLQPVPKHGIAVAKDGNNLNAVLSNVEWRDRAYQARVSRRPDMKHKTSKHCTPETKQRLYDAMKALEEPLRMSELARILEVPYSTVRYSMKALIADDKVKMTEYGYEVIT